MLTGVFLKRWIVPEAVWFGVWQVTWMQERIADIPVHFGKSHVCHIRLPYMCCDRLIDCLTYASNGRQSYLKRCGLVYVMLTKCWHYGR